MNRHTSNSTQKGILKFILLYGYSCLCFWVSSPVYSAPPNSNAGWNAKSEALSVLSDHARLKANPGVFNKLLNKRQPDFIVLLKTESNISGGAIKGLSKQAILKSQAAYSKTFLRYYSDIEILNDYQMLPMLYVKARGRAAFVDLINDENVKAVFENARHTFNLAESLPLIEQPWPEAQGHIGENTGVAVLDTGIDYTHNDFNHCAFPNSPAGCRVVFAQDFAPDDESLDDDGHGTNVAAIVAGVAPGTQIISLDVFDGLFASNSDIISAINWVIQNQQRFNIVAMNLSLGLAGSQFQAECTNSFAAVPFASAREVGVLPVLASGNDGFTDGINEPACAPGAVRVGAVFDDDSIGAADQVTWFSNTGDLLTLFAPGAFVTAGGFTMFGTSQASPHVAGAIAVMRAQDVAPDDTIDQTIDRLTRTGDTITDHRLSNFQRSRLNLRAATDDAKTSNFDLSLVPIMNLILLD